MLHSLSPINQKVAKVFGDQNTWVFDVSFPKLENLLSRISKTVLNFKKKHYSIPAHHFYKIWSFCNKCFVFESENMELTATACTAVGFTEQQNLALLSIDDPSGLIGSLVFGGEVEEWDGEENSGKGKGRAAMKRELQRRRSRAQRSEATFLLAYLLVYVYLKTLVRVR